jgi:hypothetical protein
LAAPASISTKAAAASLIPDALPAVTVPFSFRNAGLSFCHVGQATVGAEMLVHGIGNITFLAFQDDRHDLVLEVASFGSALGTVVAFHC